MKSLTCLITVSTIGLTLLTSCHHKDLYMEESLSSELEVVFDWRDAPTANPSSMAMYLYEEDGGHPLRYIFDNRTGGLIKAPFGHRHIICINADNTYWARLRHTEDIESLEISTLDAEELPVQNLSVSKLPRSEESSTERMATTPGMLWGSRTNDITIAPHTGRNVITLYPHEAICYYTVDIYDVDNLDGVQTASIDATLSGMAEAYCFGADSPTDTPVTMPFELQTSSVTSLHGEFLTFGDCPTTGKPHNLTVYMILKDGSKWWHSFDVTDQVKTAPDPKHVHIVVRGLPLPQTPDTGGTSMSASVNDWQAVNIGLQM